MTQPHPNPVIAAVDAGHVDHHETGKAEHYCPVDREVWPCRTILDARRAGKARSDWLAQQRRTEQLVSR